MSCIILHLDSRSSWLKSLYPGVYNDVYKYCFLEEILPCETLSVEFLGIYHLDDPLLRIMYEV